ncbi:MAG TPA: sensor histidine kinase [Gaiellaceae bacterium]|nr:sensor histidine kinase [Gaiellaceae bacterium]
MSAPTVASLERTRARQDTMRRLMRPLGIAAVVLVELIGIRSHPGPGLHGQGLGILVALVAFAVGVAGVTSTRRRTALAQFPFFAVLVLSSSALVALQPKGPAFLGAFVAVAAGAMRVPGRPGAAIVAVALVALPVAEVLGKDKSAFGALLQELGVIAFYLVARLAARLAEGQQQAERLVLELEQTRDAQARAAVLGERQRLAREMHDVLAHSLSGLALQLESARLRAASHDDPELVAALERAHQLARTGIEEARRAIGMLRDDELPGPERLPALVAEFERDSGIATSFSVAGEPHELGPDARLTLFRTAQEALTNVQKHASCDHVELCLVYEDGGTRLSVEDVGQLVPASNGAGYGLTGMRERAELLGGTLSAGATGAGFRVELWVPA